MWPDRVIQNVSGPATPPCPRTIQFAQRYRLNHFGGVAVRLKTAWKDTGFVDLTEFGTPEMWQGLVDEAHACEPDAKPRRFTRVESYRDGSLASPQQCRSHQGGDAILSLSRSRELLELAREATGIPRLVPTRYGYKYYRPGDFMGLHRDAVRCTITFTFALTDNLGTMHWLPRLRGASNSDLCQVIDRDGLFPSSGEEMPVTYCGLKGFDGYNVPHWRTPFDHELGILGTVCYFDL